MNKDRYKKAYSIYREIVLLEKQLTPESTSAYNYIWHRIKMLNIELSALDGWCAMEHFDDGQTIDDYEDYWWLSHNFPMFIVIEIIAGFKNGGNISYRARGYVQDYFASKAVTS